MPKYTDSLVAFYDILGFSDFVRSHPSADDIHNLFTNITDLSSFPKSSTEAFGQRFVHFSDTVIRTTPFVDPDGRDNRFGMLFYELLQAVHFQMELIWKELVWLRGAITYGPAFHGEREIYGPAVIRAYELERDVATFPRVIVDPQLLELFEQKASVLRSIHNDHDSERDYCFNLLRRGDDGIWFVDYLRAARSEADEQEFYPIYLSRHKAMILKTLSKQRSLQRVSHKYLWLCRYHNKIVEGLSGKYCKRMGISQADLLISSAEAVLYYTRPDE